MFVKKKNGIDFFRNLLKLIKDWLEEMTLMEQIGLFEVKTHLSDAELKLRRGGPLATLDNKLILAARKMKILWESK